MTKPTITIIGAGLTGCYLTILFAKRGYTVHVYERYSKKEILARSSQRSVNLTFYAYGVQVFKDAGLWKAIQPFVKKLKGSITRIVSERY